MPSHPSKNIKVQPEKNILIYTPAFNDFSFGDKHPVRLERVTAAYKLMKEMGHLDEPGQLTQEPMKMSPDFLTKSHDPNYIKILEKANSGQWQEHFIKYNLGVDDCPVFPGLFDFVKLYTAATMTGVNLITSGEADIVMNPMGGFHHSSREHAEGFCYVNDVIAAVDELLEKGYKVAYVDIDAHHGNGVQDAYYNDNQLLYISLHESGKTLYPGTGFETETGEKDGKGFTINLPLPTETDDEAYEWIFNEICAPAIKDFAPDIIVSVVGADTHKNDPLTHLSLTNNGITAVVQKMESLCKKILLLGGGGYDLNSTSRTWARLWAAVNKIEASHDYLATMGGNFIGSGELSQGDLTDMAYRISGTKKESIMTELERIAAFHLKHTMPVIASK